MSENTTSSERVMPDTDLDLKLMAYADGALSAGDAAEVAALLEQRPDFQARVDEHRSLAGLVSETYAPVIDEPVPEHLKALVLNADFSAAPATKTDEAGVLERLWQAARDFLGTGFRSGVPQFGAMAACLGIGMLIAGPVWQPGEEGGALSGDGPVHLSQPLFQSLTERPAGTYGSVEIGMTYADKSGTYCRAFHLHGENSRAGIACRTGGTWAVDMLVPAGEGATPGGYRMASSSLPPALLARIEERREGEPLDRAQEADLLDTGWQ